MSDLYKRIVELCENEGINVTEMCRRADVPRGNLTDLNKGRQNSLATKNMIKISNYFNVSVEYLQTGEIKKSPTISDESVTLSVVERELIASFRDFSDEGKKKVLDYVSDLQNTGIYKIDRKSCRVAG